MVCSDFEVKSEGTNLWPPGTDIGYGVIDGYSGAHLPFCASLCELVRVCAD